MPAKQATNDKLQGSVATYLRCGGVANNQIKKGLLLSLWVKTFLESVNIWQKLQARTWVIACNFAKYSPILIFLHSQTQQ